jgi:OmpA-OmpF porin, OOP family
MPKHTPPSVPARPDSLAGHTPHDPPREPSHFSLHNPMHNPLHGPATHERKTDIMKQDTPLIDARLFFVPLAVACVAAAVLVLTGCGTSTISKNVSEEGKAEELVFPDIDRAFLKEGVFANVDNLRNMAPGLNKDQIYDLLGRPHYAEGLSGVREWDYLLNFRNEKTGEVTRCQYKVLFDKQMLARNLHWKPQACAEQLKRAQVPAQVVAREPQPQSVAAAVPPATPQPAQQPRRMRLAADTSFELDKIELLPEGRARLDKLAGELRGRKVERVAVVGHADRLGNETHNRQLSAARAQTRG